MDWKPTEMVTDQMLYLVELADTVDESCGSVHDSLELIKLVLWSTDALMLLLLACINYCFIDLKLSIFTITITKVTRAVGVIYTLYNDL